MQAVITKESPKQKHAFKSFISNNSFQNALFIVSLIVVSFLIVLPFVLSSVHSGADYPYHLSAIEALNEAWSKGEFGKRIYDFICCDYGYGTGLFYSMLPAGIASVFMNLFHLNLTGALYLEIALLYSCSAVVVYLFTKRVFKKNWLSFLLSVIYIAFPYFFVNLYYRFAFSEMFFMLYAPMIAWSLYELVEHSNYKLFFPLFTISVSLAILTHVTIVLYVAIIALVYVLINVKKFFVKYQFVPFLGACLLVLMITATFYIPMLMNYGVVGVGSTMSMDKSWFWHVLVDSFKFNSMFGPSIWLQIFVLILFLFTLFIKSRKVKLTKLEIVFAVLGVFSFWIITPLFPWKIMPQMFLIIQYSHRLFMITSVFYFLEIGYILKNFKFVNYKVLFVCILAVVSLDKAIVVSMNAFDKYNSAYSETVITDEITGFDINHGMGWSKKGDYLPKGGNTDYVFTRVNSNLILSSSCDVKELTNNQSKSQLSFIVETKTDAEVVLNIPYENMEGKVVYQISSNYFNENLDVSFEADNGNTKIKLSGKDCPTKIIIAYHENDNLDRYLKNNPFEFVVKEGRATLSNFIKLSSSEYNVQIRTSSSAVIELPTLFYKGYKLTYTTDEDTYELEAVHNENGFIQVEVSESGKLHVEFEAGYVNASNIVSIVGAVLFALCLIALLILPRKYFTFVANWITNFLRTHKTVAEILRFIVVGGIATIIDMLFMGITMYIMQPSIYSSFINVFINAPTPSTLATIVGTTMGFIVGLAVNYVLSIAFVFNDKGKSKSAQGFLMFTVLSVIGLLINIVGMYLGFDLMHLNQWLVKIVMIIVVLIYNYISKKLLLFKKDKKKEETAIDKEDNSDKK